MRTGDRHAFTLVELLVAAGITALMAGLALMVTSHMTAAWARNVGEYGAQAQARVALDRLALDLQSALYRDDGGVWLSAAVLDNTDRSGLWETAPRQKPAGTANGSLLLNEPDLAACRFGQAGVGLCFFTAARVSGVGATGDVGTGNSLAPAAVGYQLVRRHTGRSSTAANIKYALCRAVVRPAQADARPGTLEYGFNLDPADSTSGYQRAGSTNDGTQPGDPFSLRHPASPDSILAENVVDFGLRLYRRAPAGGLERIFPASGNETEHLARTPPGGPEAAVCFPEVADVMLRVLTEEGVRRIASLEMQSGAAVTRPAEYRTDAEWWWGVVEANSRVYTRRIVLPTQLP
jgi:type II secretory pathway pseudopilin PulG